MNLTVNGKPMRTDSLTIVELLGELSLDAAKVVVEHNGQVAHRERWNERALEEGDRLEIVRFVGGG